MTIWSLVLVLFGVWAIGLATYAGRMFIGHQTLYDAMINAAQVVERSPSVDPSQQFNQLVQEELSGTSFTLLAFQLSGDRDHEQVYAVGQIQMMPGGESLGLSASRWVQAKIP